jgi:hypothetical protein
MATNAATRPKIDLFREHAAEYKRSKVPVLIDVPGVSYLVVRGQGQPGKTAFQEAVAALYAMAYTLKFQSKFAGQDYVVGKLEGLYGVDGQDAADLTNLPPEEWRWRHVIRVPDFVRNSHLRQARTTLREKGKEGDFEGVALERYDEGRCVQALHLGAYSEERATIDAMHDCAQREGLEPHLWHHEIYLSDPRRVAPEKHRTLLRHPVRAA